MCLFPVADPCSAWVQTWFIFFYQSTADCAVVPLVSERLIFPGGGFIKGVHDSEHRMSQRLLKRVCILSLLSVAGFVFFVFFYKPVSMYMFEDFHAGDK